MSQTSQSCGRGVQLVLHHSGENQSQLEESPVCFCAIGFRSDDNLGSLQRQALLSSYPGPDTAALVWSASSNRVSLPHAHNPNPNTPPQLVYCICCAAFDVWRGSDMTRRLPLSSWLCHRRGITLVCCPCPAQTDGRWRLVFLGSDLALPSQSSPYASAEPQTTGLSLQKVCQAPSQLLEIHHDSSEPQSLTWMQSVLLAIPPHNQQSICTH